MREGLWPTRVPILAVHGEQMHSLHIFSRRTRCKGSRRSPRLDEDEAEE